MISLINEIFISIIIPIYNVEKYLAKCLESLYIQNRNDAEFILVIDGSPDNSKKICVEYQNKDSRFKTYLKKNGGLSDARNYGLSKASGEYIFFLDSDDYVDENLLERLYIETQKNDLDILVTDAIKIYKDKDIKIVHSNKKINEILTGQEFLKIQLREKKMLMAVWMNMYRKDFLLENTLFFEKGLLHEDEEWTPRVFLKAEKVKYINYYSYYYIVREGSITNRLNKTKNSEHLIKTAYHMKSIYDKLSDRKLARLLNDHNISIFLNAISMSYLIGNERKKIYKRSFVIQKVYHIKTRIKIFLFFISPRLYMIVQKKGSYK